MTPMLLKNLRKRKLVQWVLAYGAGAWLLLQVLGLMAENYEWPHGVMRLAFGVVVIGLLVTIVLAWYHGERGEQKVSGTELALLTLLLAVGGGLLWRTAHVPQAAQVQAITVPALAATQAGIPDIAKDPSIAVLPFENMSSDKEQEYFSDGITEELLNLLAKVPKLRVIARTSSFSYKGKEVAIPEIARALNVAAILEGSVRKSGNTVRITVQLIRASDSTHLWSETYDRKLDDIFKVQDEIATAVVGQLKLTLLGPVAKTKPIDPKPYALILQAEYFADQNTTTSSAQALALYQQSLAIAPGTARAWDGLARVYINQANNGERPSAEGVQLARDAANKALTSDPDDAQAYARLGRIAETFDGDFAAAAPYYQRALELDPTNLRVLSNITVFLVELGRLHEAIVLAEYRAAHDPTNPIVHANLGLVYRAAGRWDQAIASFRTALTLSQGFAGGHYRIGVALLGKGDAGEALKEFQVESSKYWRTLGLPMGYQALGRKAESDAALAMLIANQEKDSSYNIAYVLAYRGEVDRAFEWLEKAVEYKDSGLASIAFEPLFATLHHDPRWLAFLRKIGKAPEQLAAIEFKVTLPEQAGVK